MIYATAVLLLCAVLSLQLSRAGNIGMVSCLIAGICGFGWVLLIRLLIIQRLRFVRSWVRNTLVFTWVGCGYALAVQVGSLAFEEWILVFLVWLASIRFISSSEPIPLRQSAFISAIVVIFALPGVDAILRLVLIISLCISGSFWLAIFSFRTRCSWSLLYIGCIIATVTVTCLFVHWTIQPRDESSGYASWIPSSGGESTGDPAARSGKGDGPDEIIGESGDSIGFDLGNTFSESGQDGLYDLWMESYGPPLDSSEPQKMVGLKPSDIRVVQGNDRENLRVGRTFELRRKISSKRASKGVVQSSMTSIWVKGPMPVYIPLAVFNDYDGLQWKEPEHHRPVAAVRRINNNWMEILLAPLSVALDRSPIEYEIRIGQLGGNTLPLPGFAQRFRMGRVNRADFFDSTDSGLVRLAHRQLPSGATLQAVCHRIDSSELFDVPPALTRNTTVGLIGTGLVSTEVRQFAENWGRNCEQGWDQVIKVIDSLRSHVILDRTQTVSGESESVQELLVVTRRGPDYQIASAAAILLRNLGYRVRLVSGFFATEEDVDPRSGFAELNAEHIHFWIEILLADGTWMTVDPSPGYPMLNVPMSPRRWFADKWTGIRNSIAAYPVTSGVSILILLSGWFLRRHMLDLVATGVCWCRGNRVQDVWRVLELRARLAGCPRASFITPAQWLHSLKTGLGTSHYVNHLNQILYNQIKESDSNACEASKDVLSVMTLRWFICKRKEVEGDWQNNHHH